MVPFTVLQHHTRRFTGAKRVVAMQPVPFELLINSFDEFESAPNLFLPAYPDRMVDHHTEIFE
jgi:hypothetical protein